MLMLLLPYLEKMETRERGSWIIQAITLSVRSKGITFRLIDLPFPFLRNFLIKRETNSDTTEVFMWLISSVTFGAYFPFYFVLKSHSFFRKDSFTVTCGSYLGRLTKIKIGHDNTGFGAAWFLDKVSCLGQHSTASHNIA